MRRRLSVSSPGSFAVVRRRLEQGDDIHQSRAAAIAGEAVAAGRAASSLHQARGRQGAQHLGKDDD